MIGAGVAPTDEASRAQWLLDRAGKITASRMSDVISGIEPKAALCLVQNGMIIEVLGNGATAEKKAANLRIQGLTVEHRVYEYHRSQSFERYALEIASEILMGKSAPTVQTRAMQDGVTREDMACAAFEVITGHVLQAVGFIQHPTNPFVGASPDRLIYGLNEGVEVKSPQPVQHLRTLLANEVPSEHQPQIQGNLWVTGYRRWHFISYNPDFRSDLMLFTKPVERDEYMIAQISVRCDEMKDRVMQIVAEVDRLAESSVLQDAQR